MNLRNPPQAFGRRVRGHREVASAFFGQNVFMSPSTGTLIRTRVYVDSFNLYYGALKGTSFKWLDLDRLFHLLLPRNDIQSIKYFTAKMESTTHKPSRATNQHLYLRALGTTPIVEIHFGRFLTTTTRMPQADTLARPRTVEVIKTEEKGSDVNLGTHLLMDAFDDTFDLAIVVSNDSDLLLPIQLVRNRFRKKVGIFNPHRKPSSSLRQNSDWMNPLRKGPLQASQFQDELKDGAGIFRKPLTW